MHTWGSVRAEAACDVKHADVLAITEGNEVAPPVYSVVFTSGSDTRRHGRKSFCRLGTFVSKLSIFEFGINSAEFIGLFIQLHFAGDLGADVGPVKTPPEMRPLFATFWPNSNFTGLSSDAVES